MAKKAGTSRGRKKRRRAASFFVSENMQTGEMTFSDASKFDAGYVKREIVAHCDPEPFAYREKYRAVTPSKRITAVVPLPNEEDAQEPKERSEPWLKKMTQLPILKKE